MRTTRKTRPLRSLGHFVVVSVAFASAFAAGSSARVSPTAPGPALAVGTSRFGPILFDARGYVLYAFTRDPRGRTTCYGSCAKAWPPYVVRAVPAARRGARSRLIGTTRRSDGRLQATYSGRPLYFYRGDDAPGVILCQNAFEYGGRWLVVRGSGSLVR